MRHSKHKYKFTMNRSQRSSMMKNLAIELIEHKKIRTTITKCKALRIFVEKIITTSKSDTLSARRLVYSKLNNRNAVQLLFKDIGPKYTSRPGGYTSIVRMADSRTGDGAEMAIISLV